MLIKATLSYTEFNYHTQLSSSTSKNVSEPPFSVACIFWNISDFIPPTDNRYQDLHHAKSHQNTVILEVKFNFYQFQHVWNPYLHWKTVILLQSFVTCLQTNTTNQQFGTINGDHTWVVS